MNIGFDSIAGYEEEKAELKRLCEMFSNPQRYEALGAKLPKGIIFYGPAGTGKTLFAKVMANECKRRIIKIDLCDGDDGIHICRKIRRAFSSASRSKQPVMIFFDELDKVLPNEYEKYCTDQSKTILAQLLTLIDGMNTSGNFVFVATCNNYDSLPETLIRPGRIDKKIAVCNPDYKSRVAILNKYIGQSACSFEMTVEELAKLCPGFSCAALETMVNECVLRSDENGYVSTQLVKNSVLEIKSDDIPRKKSTMSDTVRACRNIGFFTVARTFNSGSYVLTSNTESVCNDFFNRVLSDYDSSCYGDDYQSCDSYDDYDVSDDEDDEDNENNEEITEPDNVYFSRVDLVNTICVLLGGYAAEELVFQKTFDNMSFVFSNIDAILFNMAKQGMLGIDYLYDVRRNGTMTYSFEYIDDMNDKFQEIITDCYDKAKRIISDNLGLIRKLIPILVEKDYIDKNACEPILQSLTDTEATGTIAFKKPLL